jgi:hypothetical protein
VTNVSQRDADRGRFVAVDLAPPRRRRALPVLEAAFLLTVGGWLVLVVTHLLLR